MFNKHPAGENIGLKQMEQNQIQYHFLSHRFQNLCDMFYLFNPQKKNVSHQNPINFTLNLPNI